MRKPKASGSRKTWLPLRVLRPFGPVAGEHERIEGDILAMLGDPHEMPRPGHGGVDHPKVRVVVGREEMAALAASLDASSADPAEKDAAANALILAARDPARHTVIASLSADDFGLVVFGRSIEYVAGPDALPIAVRYVTEILGACRPAKPMVADAIADAAVGQVTFGLSHLCARAGAASTMLNAAMATAAESDEYEPFVLAIEVHLRTTPGADPDFAKLVADNLGSFEEYLRIVGSDEFYQLTIRSPYLPGSLFTRPDRAAPGDTAAHLRAREILRSASLAGRSVAATHGPVVTGEYGGRRYHVEEAEASKLPVYDVLLDPAAPRISDVLDLHRTDPGAVHVEVCPDDGDENLVVVEMERTLSVEFDGNDAVLLLDVSAPAMVGPHGRLGMPSAIAEVMMFQAKVDLESIHVDVFDRVRRYKVRFTAPVPVASAIREDIDLLHRMLDVMPSDFELVKAIVLNQSLRKPGPAPEPTPLTLLDTPVDVDLDMLHLHVGVALERQGNEFEMDWIEVLTRRDDGPAFQDIENFNTITRDPFLVLRIWRDGSPLPAVISTLTGKVFTGNDVGFREALVRSRLPPVERPAGPSGAERVRAVAEKLFTHSSIEVAHLPYLTPKEGAVRLYCNDVAAMERLGFDIEAHLVVLGDDAKRPRPHIASLARHTPEAANFHAAIGDDLRVVHEDSVLADGPQAVVAEFLARGVMNLVGSEEDVENRVPDAAHVFLFAYAYVRECLPDEISGADLASAVRRVSTGDSRPLDPAQIELHHRSTADIVGHVAAEIGNRAKAPLYLATARIAAAFKAMSDERDGFGFVPRPVSEEDEFIGFAG